MSEDKPYLELELVTQHHNGALVSAPLLNITSPELLTLIHRHVFAEVNIPHHTTNAVYCYTFHIMHKQNAEPAIEEMMNLSANIQLFHERFGHLAQPMPKPAGE